MTKTAHMNEYCSNFAFNKVYHNIIGTFSIKEEKYTTYFKNQYKGSKTSLIVLLTISQKRDFIVTF